MWGKGKDRGKREALSFMGRRACPWSDSLVRTIRLRRWHAGAGPTAGLRDSGGSRG